MEVVKTGRVSIDELATLRDELVLQAHLFKSEVSAQWERLENDWKKLKEAKPTIQAATKSAGEDVGAAADLLIGSLHDAYLKIRSSLPEIDSKH